MLSSKDYLVSAGLGLVGCESSSNITRANSNTDLAVDQATSGVTATPSISVITCRSSSTSFSDNPE